MTAEALPEAQRIEGSGSAGDMAMQRTPSAAREVQSYSWSRERPRTAPFLSRAAAFSIDLVILAVLTYVVWRLAYIVGLAPQSGFLGDYGFLVVAELPLGLAYFTVLEGLLARTPGKIFMGLRVTNLRERGASPTIMQSLVRNLLRFVWMTPVGPIFILLDLGLFASTEMDQRLGDLAGGTLVVPEGRPAGAAAGTAATRVLP
ncbi:MAG: RDD family protein [Thermoplasmatota archaeon]